MTRHDPGIRDSLHKSFPAALASVTAHAEYLGMPALLRVDSALP